MFSLRGEQFFKIVVLPVDNRLKITSICDFTLFVIQLIHGRCYFRVLFGN